MWNITECIKKKPFSSRLSLYALDWGMLKIIPTFLLQQKSGDVVVLISVCVSVCVSVNSLQATILQVENSYLPHNTFLYLHIEGKTPIDFGVCRSRPKGSMSEKLIFSSLFFVKLSCNQSAELK